MCICRCMPESIKNSSSFHQHQHDLVHEVFSTIIIFASTIIMYSVDLETILIYPTTSFPTRHVISGCSFTCMYRCAAMVYSQYSSSWCMLVSKVPLKSKIFLVYVTTGTLQRRIMPLTNLLLCLHYTDFGPRKSTLNSHYSIYIC